mmetsp:Transcript_32341/g.107926  ORF Transcript_32341/g.107926 Transcript_32341/m.107926 type:complete len:227 (+) Transcript_32341:52-732(+)
MHSRSHRSCSSAETPCRRLFNIYTHRLLLQAVVTPVIHPHPHPHRPMHLLPPPGSPGTCRATSRQRSRASRGSLAHLEGRRPHKGRPSPAALGLGAARRKPCTCTAEPVRVSRPPPHCSSPRPHSLARPPRYPLARRPRCYPRHHSVRHSPRQLLRPRPWPICAAWRCGTGPRADPAHQGGQRRPVHRIALRQCCPPSSRNESQPCGTTPQRMAQCRLPSETSPAR